MERYQARGVSAKKEEVHAAIRHVDKGLFPTAFCKVIPDLLVNDPDYCMVMHADGAGTKASLAYLYYRETGDLEVFRGIAQDALVMNTDDLLCVGALGPLMMSSTIGRNAKLVPGEVLRALITGNESVAQQLTQLGLEIVTTGGETADLGDLVRTLVVDTTVVARMRRTEILTNAEIRPGDEIIGLASFGQTTYETQYNSGIGSNGLTSARHELLHRDYARGYPESYDPEIPPELTYSGPFHLQDPLEGTPLNIGQALLSPTRTYAPIIKILLTEHREQVTGLIHCSGGGQTKNLNFGQGIRYVKDHLFPLPPLFRKIQAVSGTSWKEMYRVFNMGHRLEVIGKPGIGAIVAEIATRYHLETRVVGHCEASSSQTNQVRVASEFGTFDYEASQRP